MRFFARALLFAAVLGAAAAAEQAVQGANPATVGDLLPLAAPASLIKSRKLLGMQAQAGANQWHEPHMHLPGGGVYVPPHEHWHGDHWDYHQGAYIPPAWNSWGGGHGGWDHHHNHGGWDHHDHGFGGHGHWH